LLLLDTEHSPNEPPALQSESRFCSLRRVGSGAMEKPKAIRIFIKRQVRFLSAVAFDAWPTPDKLVWNSP